jgi:hypothetical protein
MTKLGIGSRVKYQGRTYIIRTEPDGAGLVTIEAVQRSAYEYDRERRVVGLEELKPHSARPMGNAAFVRASAHAVECD